MISIIIPFHNEEKNISELSEELKNELEKIKKEYEIILVDDGSTDNSFDEALKESRKNSKIHVRRLRKHTGKGGALVKGIAESHGDTLVFMDADLQDNPADLSGFIKKLDEGYDLVNGVRINRAHQNVIKLYSRWGNRFIRRFASSPFTDINCGFKAFRREVLQEVPLYGNNFRFLSLGAFYRGYKVTEIDVENRPRKHGVSKFGLSKAFVGFLDTMTAYFIYRFAERPLHFFGPVGGVIFSIGFVITFILTIERLFYQVELYKRPLLIAGIFLVIVGLQIALTGILAELIVYQHKKQ